jgi:phosphatidylglycerophosphatase A
MKVFNYLIATGLGLGYSPLAPGTAGSLLGLLLMYLMFPLSVWLIVLTISILFILGVYTGTVLEKDHGPDPSLVVIDEIVGMMISLILVPRIWWIYGSAFLLFRIFDIIKPPPINASQKLKGGWGIMIDDVLAGLYTLIIIHLILNFIVTP